MRIKVQYKIQNENKSTVQNENKSTVQNTK
jgi:hypothetical protein